MIVLDRFRLCRISSIWCADIWCKPERSKSGMLIDTEERLCLILGNRGVVKY